MSKMSDEDIARRRHRPPKPLAFRAWYKRYMRMTSRLSLLDSYLCGIVASAFMAGQVFEADRISTLLQKRIKE